MSMLQDNTVWVQAAPLPDRTSLHAAVACDEEVRVRIIVKVPGVHLDGTSISYSITSYVYW